MTVAAKTVSYERDGAVGVITLSRPPVNAYSEETLQSLRAAWKQAATDDAARVIVLRAEGKHFCAGADLDEEAVSKLKGEWAPGDYESQRNLPKPTIAAVQGACVAGGQRFVWPCDLIVAADDAFFRDPLMNFDSPGIPLPGHTWEYGPRLAKEMIATACSVPAERARRAGMVNRVVPRGDLDREVMTLAREIAEMDPFGLAQAKRVVNQTMDVIGQQYMVNRFNEIMAAGFEVSRSTTHAGPGRGSH